MKTVYRNLAFLLLLAACGKNSDPVAVASTAPTCSTHRGSYYDLYNPSQTLTIGNDCTFSDSYCGYTASYTAPEEGTGATFVTVIGTNGTPGCMSSTVHACTIRANGVQLAINCDSGANSYLFVKQ